MRTLLHLNYSDRKLALLPADNYEVLCNCLLTF